MYLRAGSSHDFRHRPYRDYRRDEDLPQRVEDKPTVAAVIKRAAASVGMDMRTFMASSAFQAAREIERAQQQTLLPETAFDAFAAAVGRPGRRNQALGQLFQKRAEMIKGE